jgi:hypothetical protein
MSINDLVFREPGRGGDMADYATVLMREPRANPSVLVARIQHEIRFGIVSMDLSKQAASLDVDRVIREGEVREANISLVLQEGTIPEREIGHHGAGQALLRGNAPMHRRNARSGQELVKGSRAALVEPDEEDEVAAIVRFVRASGKIGHSE